MKFTTDQKIACVERELNLRRSAYPRWVAGGRMSQAIAEREIGCMEAILADYKHLKRREEPELFSMEGGAR